MGLKVVCFLLQFLPSLFLLSSFFSVCAEDSVDPVLWTAALTKEHAMCLRRNVCFVRRDGVPRVAATICVHKDLESGGVHVYLFELGLPSNWLHLLCQ